MITNKIHRGLPYKIKRNIYYAYKNYGHYKREHKFYKNRQVKLYNWCNITPEFWLIRFIEERGLLNYFNGKTISIYSVFGHRFNIYRNRSDFKIFYTGENIHVDNFSFSGKYNDNLLNEKIIDLSIGFDYLNNEKYIRFPLWILYLFSPDSKYEDIKTVCNNINNRSTLSYRDKFCSLLARMDRFGYREILYQQISTIDKIDCDGLFRHNNDDLAKLYNDDKIAYLNNYKFNLCPENSNHPGYCTEKVFEAIKAGCIPLYWGSDNKPEPDILNHDSILFINPFEPNVEALKLISDINSNRSVYLDFINQNNFLQDAPDIIYNYFLNLEEKIKAMASNLL